MTKYDSQSMSKYFSVNYAGILARCTLKYRENVLVIYKIFLKTYPEKVFLYNRQKTTLKLEKSVDGRHYKMVD